MIEKQIYDYIRTQPRSRLFMFSGMLILTLLLYVPVPRLPEGVVVLIGLIMGTAGVFLSLSGVALFFYELWQINKSKHYS